MVERSIAVASAALASRLSARAPLAPRLLQGWNAAEARFSGALLGLSAFFALVEVILRYLLLSPTIWIEEVVRYLIIAAAFVSASSILAKDQHIRLEFFVGRLPRADRLVIEIATSLGALVFSLYLTVSGVALVMDAWQLDLRPDTPLNPPLFIPYLILPLAGILLSLRLALWLHHHLAEIRAAPGTFPLFTTLLGLVIGGLLLAGLKVIPDSYLFAALAGMLALFLVAGMPIAFSMGLSSLAVILTFDIIKLSSVSEKLFWNLNHFVLVAIPFFILAGNLMMQGALAERLFQFASNLFGSLRGGLAVTAMASCIIFAAVTGVSAASAAAIGLVAMPALLKDGYDKDFSAGIIAAGGTLGILIPPSIMMILYGAITGESIAKLFLAGLVPGLLLGLALMLFIMVLSRRRQVGEPVPFSGRALLGSLKRAWWVLCMPVVILGGIYGGIFTPTEAAAVAIAYAVLASMVARTLTFRKLATSLVESSELTAIIFFILASALLLGFIITYADVPMGLFNLLVKANLAPWSFLLIINLAILVMGCFLDPGSILFIVVPLIYPILQKLRIDPVHFAVILTVNMEIGFITPPVGMNLFVLKSISNQPLEGVIRGVLPFIALLLGGLALVTYWPTLSLWLPGLLFR